MITIVCKWNVTLQSESGVEMLIILLDGHPSKKLISTGL